MKKAKNRRRSRLATMFSLSVVVLGTMANAAAPLTTVKADDSESNPYNVPGVTKDNLDELPASFSHYGVSIPMSEFPVYGSMHGEPLVHTEFNADGYLAWCLNYNKVTPDASTYSTEKQDTGDNMYHVLLNGFPMKSTQQLGLDNLDEALAATQEVVWDQNVGWNGGFNLDDVDYTDGSTLGLGKPSLLSERQRVKMAAQEIKQNASVDTRTQSEPQIIASGYTESLPEHSSSSQGGSGNAGNDNDGYWTITSTPDGNGQGVVDPQGNTTFTFHTKITGGYKPVNAKFSTISGPAGMVVKQGDRQVKEGDRCDVGEDYTVTIPAQAQSEKTADFSVQISTQTDGWLRANGYVNSGDVQNTLVQNTGNARAKTIKTPWIKYGVNPTLGEIHLHKQGEGQEALKGIRFNLINEDDNSVVQQGVTDDSGNLVFKKVPHGHYIIREANTDPDHELNLQDQHVELTDDEIVNAQFPTVNVQNTEIKDQPILQSYATEVDSDDTKGSRLVDAKYEDLQDEILADNLDDGHSYKIVDTLYDRSTGQPLKLKDGSVAQASQTFTAKKADPNKGHDRGYFKATLKYSQVDLHGLQGDNIYAKANIYRVANDQVPTHDGEELATEDTTNNVNQTLHVLSPKISTVATANASSAGKDKVPTGNKVTNPYSKTKINDWANITDLVKGHKYTVHLKEMTTDDQGNPVEYKDPTTNKPVTVEKTFTADGPTKQISTDFPEFSTVDQQGKKLTVYYNVTPADEDDDKLGYQEDITDASETVRVTTPQVKTKASIDGDTISNPTKTGTVVDTATVTDVAPNQPLELGAVLSDSKSNAVQLKEKKQTYVLMGKTTVTPKSDSFVTEVPLEMVNAPKADSNGDIKIADAATRQKLNSLKAQKVEDIKADPVKAGAAAGGSDQKQPYQINTRKLAGQKTVVFEDLWELPDKPLASHADVNDQGQTIEVTNPKIHTEALLNDHHTSNPQTKSHLADKVSYEGVAPGHELDLDAVAVDPQTGVNIALRTGKDGSKVYNLMGKKRFYPAAAKGETTVPLQKVTATKESVDASKNKDKVNPNKPAAKPETKPNQTSQEQVAGDQTNGQGNFKLSVKITKNDSDADIKDGIKKVNALAKRYGVDTTKLNDYLNKSQTPFSSSDKHYLLDEYKSVAAAIKKAQGASGTGNKIVLQTSISKNSSDSDIQRAVKDLSAAADYYGLETSSLDDVVAKAKKPMTATDKDEIVSAFNNLVSKVKEKQKSAQDSLDQNSGTNANQPTDDTQKYDVVLSGSTKAKQRVKDNQIQAQDPRIDDSKPNSNADKYLIDTSSLRGQKMVMVEDLVNSEANPVEGNNVQEPITSEIDVNNLNQTVRVTNPKIHTMQTIDNQKDLVLDGKNTKVPLKDTVSYTDLAPDEQVVLNAAEMDTGAKRPFLINNQYLYGRKTFIPANSDGKVSVYFNPQDDAPAARYLTTMLDQNGMTANSSVVEDTSEAIDNNTNATDGDQTNHGSTGKGENAKNPDYSNKPSNTSGDQTTNGGYNSVTGSDLGTNNADSSNDTSAYDIDLSDLNNAKTSKTQMTAFETLETTGKNSNIIAEHKDYSDADQTVTVTHGTNGHSGHGHGGSTNINGNANSNSNANSSANSNPSSTTNKNKNKQKQHQSQTNGDNTNTATNGNVTGGNTTITINNDGSNSGSNSGSNAGTNTDKGSKDGKDGKDGANAANGQNGQDGKDGKDGKDGSDSKNDSNSVKPDSNSSDSKGSSSDSDTDTPSSNTTPNDQSDSDDSDLPRSVTPLPTGNGADTSSGFAQTGGSSKLSSNHLYNWFYGLVYKVHQKMVSWFK